MDEIETADNLNVLLNYVMKAQDEYDFYTELHKKYAFEAVRIHSTEASLILSSSIKAINDIINEHTRASLPYQLAKTNRDKALLMLSQKDWAIIQDIFDMRKAYLMKYTRLERLFLSKYNMGHL